MKILLVWTHPVPESYNAALRDSVLNSLRSLDGTEVELLDLYTSGFDPKSPEGVIAQHRAKVQAANALVFVYPTWWDALPAMLKAWLEHLLPNALDTDKAQEAAKEITGHITDIVAVTTHGSSRRVNFVQGRAGRLLLLKSLRSLCHHSCRTRWISLYSIDRASHKKRQNFLTQAASQASKHFQKG